MPFEEGLFKYLDNHAGLSMEIDDRLYPLLLPQDATLPAVTYQRISTVRLLEFEQSFMPHPRFQFNCWAMNTTDTSGYEIAKGVAEQVRTALDVYIGSMGDETVRASIIDGERDMYDPATGIWNSIIEAVIWHV